MDPITEWTLRLGWILPVWLFALGGTIGSFLNVVVYRLPAGQEHRASRLALPGLRPPDPLVSQSADRELACAAADIAMTAGR